MRRVVRPMSHARSREDGAAAVEFALIVGVLVMLLFGMLQFGLAFFELQNLRAATREGARFAALGAPLADIQAKVQEASLGSIPGDNAAIDYTECPASPNDDDSARVAIDINDGALPARLQQIFSVDIPFVPTIQLNAIIYGEFRCES